MVIGLVLKHPAAGGVFEGQDKDAATYVTMPGKGFRVELTQFARRAAATRSSGGNGRSGPAADLGR